MDLLIMLASVAVFPCVGLAFLLWMARLEEGLPAAVRKAGRSPDPPPVLAVPVVATSAHAPAAPAGSAAPSPVPPATQAAPAASAAPTAPAARAAAGAPALPVQPVAPPVEAGPLVAPAG